MERPGPKSRNLIGRDPAGVKTKRAFPGRIPAIACSKLLKLWLA